jgi:hypothetical protein
MLALALLAWPAWEAWRWELVRRVYINQEPAAPTVTPKHVQALRKLRFAWNPAIEGGGPVVDPLTPYGTESLAADLGPILGTRDKVAVARFHREVSSLLIWALKHGDLAAGDYRLADLNNAAMQGRLRRELARYPGLPLERVEAIVAEVPRLDPDGQFRFSDQHRRLLRELRLEWPDQQILWFLAGFGYPAPAVHFKRPFGDMTAFEIDMAAILGLPRPRDDAIDPLLARLYWEMWPALQAFVEHVDIKLTAQSAGN